MPDPVGIRPVEAEHELSVGTNQDAVLGERGVADVSAKLLLASPPIVLSLGCNLSKCGRKPRSAEVSLRINRSAKLSGGLIGAVFFEP